MLTVRAELAVPTRTDPKATEEGESAAAGAVPVPLRVRLWGESAASSVTTTLAVRAPVVPGAKRAVIVQLSFGASVAGQSSLTAKSPGFAPARATLETCRPAVPVLRTVAVCAALAVSTRWAPKARLDGVTAAAGAVGVPVPPTGMLCGVSGASSPTTRFALRAPVSDGAKLTVIVQVAPTASVLPQSPADWKSPAFAPVKPIDAIASVAVPVLRRATGW